MKKYQLTSGELCPLGRGLGGQLSISGKYITIWDLGPQAENEALRHGEKKIFPAETKIISAFQQQFKVQQLEKSDQSWTAVLEAVKSPEPEVSAESNSDDLSEDQPAGSDEDEVSAESDSEDLSEDQPAGSDEDEDQPEDQPAAEGQ